MNHGFSEIFKCKGGTITDEDIEQLLKRGEDRTKQMEEEISKRVEEQAKGILDLNIASINIYDYQGQDYHQKRKEDEAA